MERAADTLPGQPRTRSAGRVITNRRPGLGARRPPCLDDRQLAVRARCAAAPRGGSGRRTGHRRASGPGRSDRQAGVHAPGTERGRGRRLGPGADRIPETGQQDSRAARKRRCCEAGITGPVLGFVPGRMDAVSIDANARRIQYAPRNPGEGVARPGHHSPLVRVEGRRRTLAANQGRPR